MEVFYLSNVFTEVPRVDYFTSYTSWQEVRGLLVSAYGEPVRTIITGVWYRELFVVEETSGTYFTYSYNEGHATNYITLCTINDSDTYSETWAINTGGPTTGGTLTLSKMDIGTLHIALVNATYVVVTTTNFIEGQGAYMYSAASMLYTKIKNVVTAYDRLGMNMVDMRAPYLVPVVYGGIPSSKVFTHNFLKNSVTDRGFFAKHEGNICFCLGSAVIFP